MRQQLLRKGAAGVGVLLIFLAGCLVGRRTAAPQNALLHVFAYTPLPGATQKDFDNFRAATVAMVGQIPGLKRVWVGKLREPVPALNDTLLTYGVAMEFDSAQSLDAYASNPVHKEWEKVYEKVRTQGTTTLNILSH